MLAVMIRARAAFGTKRPARALAVAVALLAFAAGDAAADTSLCRQLEARLAATGSGNIRQAKRYEKALQRQQQEIEKARDQARQAGCGRAIFGSKVAFCGSINASLQRMERNFVKLQQERARFGSGGGTAERSRLMAAIDANGCRSERRAPPTVKEASIKETPEEEVIADDRPDARIGTLTGNFRTLCVRTCDGYYFPISYSVPPSAFERDGKACAAMCPGTEVELHYHRVPGEEPADMVSAVTGIPYREMSTAFRYREPGAKFPPSCGCTAAERSARGFEVIGGDYQPETETEIVTPAAEESPSVEEIGPPAENEGGGGSRTAAGAAQPSGEAEARAVIAADRDVRVVGPRFLPDPEEAIDLRAPGPTRDP